MSKFYKIIFLFSLIIIGCTNERFNNKKVIQSIDDFHMIAYAKNGDKIYSINSPNSTYSKENNIFSSSETTIKVFRNNKAEYVITSDKSILSNNENLLEMNGNILIKALLHQEDKLYANEFVWNINNSEYLLNGNVKFENNLISLSSNKAILNKGSNVIEFFNPVKYTTKGSSNSNLYQINSENAYYDIETKSVSFKSTEKRVRSKIYF